VILCDVVKQADDHASDEYADEQDLDCHRHRVIQPFLVGATHKQHDQECDDDENCNDEAYEVVVGVDQQQPSRQDSALDQRDDLPPEHTPLKITMEEACGVEQWGLVKVFDNDSTNRR